MQRSSIMITGAGSGIGRAIATRLSTEGYFVYLVGRSQEKLNQTQSLCPGPSLTISTDLSENKAVTSLTQNIEVNQEKFPLVALINNAAIFHRLTFDATSFDVWDLQYQNTLMSTVRATKACLPFLRKSSGSLVNISSTLGSRPIKETSAYSAMKAALNNLSQSLALELAADKVRVNVIEPGLVDTPIHSFHTDPSPEVRKQLDSLQPLGRMGRPEDIAQAVSFLINPDNTWMTGAVFPVDGGISL